VGEGTLPIAPRQGVDFARYRRTDAGNALAFVDLFGEDLRFIESLKAWLVWTGARWQGCSVL
jgi:hypothetical protein